MEGQRFRLRKGQSFVFTATRPCKVRFARVGAALFEVSVSEAAPKIKDAVPETVAKEPRTMEKKHRETD